MAEDPPSVYDHYRPSGEDAPVFRVVGVDESHSDSSANEGNALVNVDESHSDSSANEGNALVNVDDGRVTLLRLTDATGNREPTGDLRHVDRDRLDATFEPAADPDPRFETPDYLAALMALAGGVLLAHPAGDRLSGAILTFGGGYLLWRRH